MWISQSVKDTLSSVQKELDIKNHNAVPRISSVIVAMGIWSLATRKGMKDFSEQIENIKTITWQQPVIVYSKKSVSNFKLREWMPVMIKVTLRNQKAYDFLQRLTYLVLPTVRDFSWISNKSFDDHGNYSLWLKNYSLFPELNLDDVKLPLGMQITITTSTKSKNESKTLLQKLWFIFQK